MKFNKWTVGLAAAGIVTLPSMTQAAAPNMVQTMAENTTLSGYVDTSAQWNMGNGNANNAPSAFNGQNKADGFNLNVVDIALEKPLDETPWAAGYKAELWFGPDANTLASQSGINYNYEGVHNTDFAVRQAYVALRTPIGNGIDWKIGVWDTILGYESTSSPNNPNFTRSYGYSVEPTTATGFLATYRFCDNFSASAGMANDMGAAINERNNFGGNEQTKAYTAGFTFTAPQDWGWLAGSSMSAAIMHGWSSAAVPEPGDGPFPGDITSVYAGVTLSTPVTGLKVGGAFDYRHVDDARDIPFDEGSGDTYVFGLYASYQATEKLSLHVRGEYMNDEAAIFQDTSDLPGTPSAYKTYELTLTAQYDLWKNVISRVEFRWDHADNADYYGGSTFTSGANSHDAYMLAANVIYKF